MKKILVLVLVIMLPTLAVFPLRAYAEAAVIYIDPPLITGLSIGNIFYVNVTVRDVVRLFAWSFQLCYKSEVLNASHWNLGPVFKPSDVYNITVIWTDRYNATHGLIQIDCTFLGDVSFSGSAVLATVYFRVKSEGSTVLHLQNTLLFDDSYPVPREIPHTTVDGEFGGVTAKNIAVVQITPSKTVVNDTVVLINVTVANYGLQSETFDVTLYYDSVEIETKTVRNLAPAALLSLNFTWDTTPVAKGKYTLSAMAHPLPDETNTVDNTFTDGIITETIRGDVNGDFKVSIEDVFEFAKAFNRTPGHPKWNPNCDLNNDEKINIEDIFDLARNFGKQI
jgi:hypothetical protein